VFPVRYELGFYIPEDGILHSHRHENLKFSVNRKIILASVHAVMQNMKQVHNELDSANLWKYQMRIRTEASKRVA
jgi:hypothetical protein